MPDTISKLMPWGVAVVFACGGAYGALHHAQGEIDRIEVEIKEHQAIPAHHAANAELARLEARMVILEEQRRDIAGDIKNIKEKQYEIANLLNALCSSDPRCKLK